MKIGLNSLTDTQLKLKKTMLLDMLIGHLVCVESQPGELKMWKYVSLVLTARLRCCQVTKKFVYMHSQPQQKTCRIYMIFREYPHQDCHAKTKISRIHTHLEWQTKLHQHDDGVMGKLNGIVVFVKEENNVIGLDIK